MTDADRPILALPQVKLAERLGVSDRTIRNWHRRGIIRGERRGGIVLYPLDQFPSLRQDQKGVDVGDAR